MLPYLKSLEPYFNILASSDDFTAVRNSCRPIYHGVMMMWCNLPHFARPHRLLPLLQMVCNDFVGQCTNFCDSKTLLELEPPEALERLSTCLQAAIQFQKDFFRYKNEVSEKCPSTPWTIPSNLLFHRLDIFMERCKDVRSLVETLTHFERTEKIEIGGTKGHLLSESIANLYAGTVTCLLCLD